MPDTKFRILDLVQDIGQIILHHAAATYTARE